MDVNTSVDEENFSKDLSNESNGETFENLEEQHYIINDDSVQPKNDDPQTEMNQLKESMSENIAEIDKVLEKPEGNEENKPEGKGEHAESGHGHPESNIVGTAAQQMNTVLGAGISSMPYSFAEAGIFAGMIVIIIMAAVTDWSLNVLMKVGKITGEKNYENVSKKAMGMVGYIITCFFMFIVAYFACLAYLTVIGDTLPSVVAFVFRLDPGQ